MGKPILHNYTDSTNIYPLMKKELAALEEEKQAIAEKVSVATWQEPVRVSAIGDRERPTRLLSCYGWKRCGVRPAFTSKPLKTCWPTLTKRSGNLLNYTTLTVIPYGK